MGVVEVLDTVAPARAGGWKVDVSRGERNGRVSSEWFNRPDDERYLSLDDLWANVKGRSERSRSRVVQTADIRVEAARDNYRYRFAPFWTLSRPSSTCANTSIRWKSHSLMITNPISTHLCLLSLQARVTLLLCSWVTF
jgi:hypothetical protein